MADAGPIGAVSQTDYSQRYFGPIESEAQLLEWQLPDDACQWVMHSHHAGVDDQNDAPTRSRDHHDDVGSGLCFYLHELPDSQAGDVFFEKVLPNLDQIGRDGDALAGSKSLISFELFDVRTQRFEFLASRILDIHPLEKDDGDDKFSDQSDDEHGPITFQRVSGFLKVVFMFVQ